MTCAQTCLKDSLPLIAIWGEWIIYPLPHQKSLIEAQKGNQVLQQGLRKQIKEKVEMMNFQEAITAARAGAKVKRVGWDSDMWMTWYDAAKEKGFLVHSHPYVENQPSSTPSGEFFYITENDDHLAQDWMRVA